MASVQHAVSVLDMFIATENMHRNSTVSAFEKRRRLTGREADMNVRELVGRWVDERPEQGDSLSLYKESGRYFLETWFSDGCHSRDEMTVTEHTKGLRLDDVGGNFFGEFFVVTEAGLEFHNFRGCFYRAPVCEETLVA
ncbi:conserved hypothetical protein [Shewanella amazonensis SB2B]|uniref:Uncharacterized protein n=1 Tax=Shewanella amazonensis (strain ATCC BAA-1098 / SB2B) TaxID=326297 RepID=A1S7P7_SHEAM|nr:conserved hypothetical protein [Shewanella amazonensis SB2B]